MKGIIGIAGVTLKETLRSGVIILLPLYAVFLGSVIAYYPSIDEESSFRQALSYGHGALHFSTGMICLLVGITTVAGDRESRRAMRCVTTGITRNGYLLGKAVALVGFALLFGLSLWAVEVAVLRWSFRDRPDTLRARPLLEPISFDVHPGGGLGRMRVPGDVHPLVQDRVKWRFPRPDDPPVAVVLDLRIDPESRGTAVLRVRAPGAGRREDHPLHGPGPFAFPIFPWPEQDEEVHVILFHDSKEDFHLLGDPRRRGVCTIRTRGGAVVEPLPSDEFWQGVRDGEIHFQRRRAIWRFGAEVAHRVVMGRVDPFLGDAGARTLRLDVSMRRTGSPLADRTEVRAVAGASFAVPDAVREGEGDLLVEVVSPEGEVLFDFGVGPDGAPRNSILLTAAPEPIEWSLLVGAMAAVCQGVLLACLGMAASLVFSTPAALVVGLGVFTVGLGAGLLEEIPRHGEVYDPIAEVFGYETGASRELVRIAACASMGVPDMARFDLKGRIVGSYVLGAAVLPGLVLYAAAVAAASLLPGWLLFRRMDFR